MIEVMTVDKSNLYIFGNVVSVVTQMKRVVVLMNIDLVKAVANKVSDEDSVILWDILNKEWPEEKHDIIYAIALSMLEEVGEEE
tara:strand:+ start:1135 stop:1386 length:252 start_codon:yes stop_codon:yes gene_type:complete